MRLLLTGGGTAGHVLPHIAVLSAVRRESRDSGTSALCPHSFPLDVLYIGSAKGPERGIMESWARQLGGQNSQADCPMKFRFVSIPVGKLRRYFDFHNFVDPFRVVMGFFKSLWLVARFKPDILFSKGGYVSVPVTLAAWVLRVPIILHDSDAKPSLTTRLCGRFVAKICLGYKEALDHLPLSLQKKCVVTGIPLRREIFEGKKEEGYAMTGFTAKKPVVLVMGGSLGSEKINRVVEEALPQLLTVAQVVHLTGPRPIQDQNPITKELPPLQTTDYRLQISYKSFPSVPNEKLPHLYAIADVVVTRAGANSLAELCALHKKMVVIPLGSAASHGDQLANAKIIGKEARGVVILEEELNAGHLLAAIKHSY